MKRILIAGLLGGIAVFIWGFISWVVLPWHNMTIKSLPNEEAVVQMLQDANLQTGVYYFPGMKEEKLSAEEAEQAMKEWAEKHRRGPLGTFFYHSGGTAPMSASTMVTGFLISLLAAVLAAYLLSSASAHLVSYGRRVLFVTFIGLFAALVSHVTMWNWFYMPVGYSLVNTIDLIVSWLIAGLVIAWRIKPQTAQ
ncbi:MAG: hypothetical protein Kow0042_29270 [Calditrichia bacterium]